MVRLLLLVLAAAACDGTPDYRVTADLGPDIRALASDDLDVQDAAQTRLAALGEDALPALEKALHAEPPAVQTGVVEALRHIHGPAALRLLIATAASNATPDVRYAAIQALGARGEPGARDTVEAALDDRDPTIRLAAEGACPALCASPPALSRLVALAIHDQPLANGIAARSAVVHLLVRDDAALRDALRAAVATQAPDAIAHGSGDAPLRAALLASDVGDASGAERLAAAARGDASPLLRLHAVYALGSVGDERAVAVLAAMDGDAAAGGYAWDALSRLSARGVAGAAQARDAWRGARPATALPPPPGMR